MKNQQKQEKKRMVNKRKKSWNKFRSSVFKSEKNKIMDNTFNSFNIKKKYSSKIFQDLDKQEKKVIKGQVNKPNK
jgi:hypothetical protein